MFLTLYLFKFIYSILCKIFSIYFSLLWPVYPFSMLPHSLPFYPLTTSINSFPMLFPSYPFSLIFPSIRPLKNPKSFLFIIFIHSMIFPAIWPIKCSSSMLFILQPISLKHPPIRINLLSMALDEIVYKWTTIKNPIRPCKGTCSTFEILIKFAFILCIIWVNFFPHTLFFILQPISLIYNII